jgi:NADPH:quinone reductase-like Zn-dependent oxidoreductase
MLAAQYFENSDDISTIQLRQVVKPEAKEGYVVVKVHVAAINPIDVMVMKGFAKAVLQWPMPLPFTMGYDFSGVVDSVHGSDSGFTVGERVFAVNWGNHNTPTPTSPSVEHSRSTSPFPHQSSASCQRESPSSRRLRWCWSARLPTRSYSTAPKLPQAPES